MAGLTVKVGNERRSAEVTVNAYWAKQLHVVIGTHQCFVLGIFQINADNEAYPVAICELQDGSMISMEPRYVRFTDMVRRCDQC